MNLPYVSSFCRAVLPEFFLRTITEAGKHEIALGTLPPRQVRIVSNTVSVPSTLKWHRDAFISTLSREVAHDLVSTSKAIYCPQYALVYTMEDYVSDPDVGENERTKALATGAGLVVVAVIGESRSALSVCRNIVSGVQNILTLVEDAKGAVDSESVFLIEE